MTLNMGPHHPSTHGVLRFIVHTDGEIIRKAVARRRLPAPLDREDRRALHLPRLHAVHRPRRLPRGDVRQRVLGDGVREADGHRGAARARSTCASSRASSTASRRHMIALGAMAMDVGAVTPFPYTLRERESINDFIEELCGARLTYNYHRIGGVSFDCPKGWDDEGPQVARPLRADARRVRSPHHDERHLHQAPGRTSRVITKDEAIAFGLVGPEPARERPRVGPSQGRRATPSTRSSTSTSRSATGQMGTVGDCWDRFWVRVEECRESCEDPPAGASTRSTSCRRTTSSASSPRRCARTARPTRASRARAATWAATSSARGKEEPYRARFRTGSFNAMGIIEAKSGASSSPTSSPSSPRSTSWLPRLTADASGPRSRSTDDVFVTLHEVAHARHPRLADESLGGSLARRPRLPRVRRGLRVQLQRRG